MSKKSTHKSKAKSLAHYKPFKRRKVETIARTTAIAVPGFSEEIKSEDTSESRYLQTSLQPSRIGASSWKLVTQSKNRQLNLQVKDVESVSLPRLTLRRSGDGTGKWMSMDNASGQQDSNIRNESTSSSSVPSDNISKIDPPSTQYSDQTDNTSKSEGTLAPSVVGEPSDKSSGDESNASSKNSTRSIDSKHVVPIFDKLRSISPVGSIGSPKQQSQSHEDKAEALIENSQMETSESQAEKAESQMENLEIQVKSEEELENVEILDIASDKQSIGSSKDRKSERKETLVIGTAKVDVLNQSSEQCVDTGSPRSKQNRKSKMPKRSAVYTDGKIQGYVVKKSPAVKPILKEMEKLCSTVGSKDQNNNGVQMTAQEKPKTTGKVIDDGHVSPTVHTQIVQGSFEGGKGYSDVTISHKVSASHEGMESHDVTVSHDITALHDVESVTSHDTSDLPATTGMKSPSQLGQDSGQVTEYKKEGLRLPVQLEGDIETSQSDNNTHVITQDPDFYTIGQNVIHIVPEKEPIEIKQEVEEIIGVSTDQERTGDTEIMDHSENPGYQSPYEDAYLEHVTSVSQQVRA